MRKNPPRVRVVIFENVDYETWKKFYCVDCIDSPRSMMTSIVMMQGAMGGGA